MSETHVSHLESLLEGVSPSRRNFLRNLLLAGAGTAMLAIPCSSLADDEPPPGDGDGKGKGKGKGKGDGKGKGKGKGKCKGKGKGKGKGDEGGDI